MKKLSTYAILLFSAGVTQYAMAEVDRITAAEAMNESWTAGVCENAEQGSELADRCAGVLGGAEAGPTAASGNNTAISSSLGNAAHLSDKHHKDRVKKRLEELEEKSAGDILDLERFGFFASGKTTQTDRITTRFEIGHDSDLVGATIGMDYFFTDKLVAGFALGYSDTDVVSYNEAGRTDLDAISTLFYASYAVTDDFMVDGYVGWTGIDYDITRNISYTATCCNGRRVTDVVNSSATAQTNADKISAGIAASYRWNYDALSVIPRLKLDYTGTFIDGYTETGGAGLALNYQEQEIQSLKMETGVDVNYAISIPWGVIIPNASAAYVHEFSDNSRTIHTSFVQDTSAYNIAFDTDKPDRDYMVMSAGMSAVLPHGIQLFVDYERVELHRYIDSYTVSGGVRVGF